MSFPITTNLTQLAQNAECLRKIHHNMKNKRIYITDEENKIQVMDSRLEQLIWDLWIESLEILKKSIPDLK